MWRAALGGVALAVLACRDPGTSTASPAAPRDAAVPRDAARPDAGGPSAYQPAPGSWPYVEALSRCVVRLRPAPPAERAKVLAAAQQKLSVLGGRQTLELTPLGDRVLRVDIAGGKPGIRRPRTVADANALAIAALGPVAAVFGLAFDEAVLTRYATLRVRGVPGVAWESHARVVRQPPANAPMPVRTGDAAVVVDLDARGGVVTLKVDYELLPPITLCTDELPDDAIERAVLGTRLTWNGWEGFHDEGMVERADIRRTTRLVMRVAGSHWDNDLTIGSVYAVDVERGHHPWTILVDPSTGTQVAVVQSFIQ